MLLNPSMALKLGMSEYQLLEHPHFHSDVHDKLLV